MILVFKLSILLTLFTTGIFLLFGCVYSFIEKRNTRYVLSALGSKGILFTGVVGTTIHEISHLIMCLIFNHKVIDFQLFNFKGYKYDEVLGYVSHKYNNKNLYEKSGNFFIGIAPIIFGTLFIIFSFRFLLPSLYSLIDIQNYTAYLKDINLSNIILLLLELCKSLFLVLFKIENLSNINFYIFIYLMFCVTTHISLSKKDFQNSSAGVFSLFIIYFIICFLYLLFNQNLDILLMSLINYGIYLIVFLSVGLFFSLTSLLISYFIYKLKK
ncbi:MAG: hypothetical protein RSG52_01020 [Terrisporobacter sp.]|uniref:hypothetical protein n=1 Tax=Terrisporobacter sp. TaxID=1965305 RepID=UPI002FC970B8